MMERRRRIIKIIIIIFITIYKNRRCGGEREERIYPPSDESRFLFVDTLFCVYGKHLNDFSCVRTRSLGFVALRLDVYREVSFGLAAWRDTMETMERMFLWVSLNAFGETGRPGVWGRKENLILFVATVVSVASVFSIFLVADPTFLGYYPGRDRIALYPNLVNMQDGQVQSTAVTVEVNGELEPVYFAQSHKNMSSSVDLLCESSVEGACRSAHNMFDKSKTTRWSSEWTDEEWVWFRVSDPDPCVSFKHLAIVWEAAAATKYALDTSFDGTRWTELHRFSIKRNGWKVQSDLITFNPPIVTRFFRIRGLKRATKYGYSIFTIVPIKVKLPLGSIETTASAEKRRCKRLTMAIYALGGEPAVPEKTCVRQNKTAALHVPFERRGEGDSLDFFHVYPYPKSFRHGKTAIKYQPNFDLRVIPSASSWEESGILDRAIRRFETTMLSQKRIISTSHVPDVETTQIIIKLTHELDLDEKAKKPTFLELDETYRLSIPSQGQDIVLEASSYIGVLRGLTTLHQVSQTIKHPDCGEGPLRDSCFVIRGAPIVIDDYPEAMYRGVLVDSARAFLPVAYVKRVIDVMEMMKYNVLHWHLSDDINFALRLTDWDTRALWQRGSCSETEIDAYSHQDVKDVLQYATDRGIIVIPELDLPGHALSWQKAFPAEMGTKPCGEWGVPIDVTKEEAYQLVFKVYKEVRRWFQLDGGYMHLGGDEVHSDCWENDEGVMERAEDLNVSPSLLGSYFFLQALNILKNSLKSNILPIIYEDSAVALLSINQKLPSSFIVHSWKTHEYRSVIELTKQRGIRLISSSGWYLNDDDSEQCKSFRECYSNGPLSYSSTGTIGGEVAMWEFKPHMFSEAIGRMAAISERLWSNQPNVRSTMSTLDRAREFYGWLEENGVTVEEFKKPENGFENDDGKRLVSGEVEINMA